MYKIIYAKPKDEGRSLSVSFDAVHQFFYDFDHSNCYKEFNGSNRFEVYIEEIFKDSGYRYVIEAQAGAIRKENFGNASRLKMFKDIIKAAGLEFSVTGKVVRIVKKVGTDLSTVVRKNFNMNELTLEKILGPSLLTKRVSELGKMKTITAQADTRPNMRVHSLGSMAVSRANP